MRIILILLPIFIFGACSDDGGGPADTRPADLAKVDAAMDQSVPDKAVDAPVPDLVLQPDGPPPTILALENHTGWGDRDCGKGGCHSLPVKGHTQSKPPQCAECHGANGACDANGVYSTKKDHKKIDNCLNCHPSIGHGYTKNADCVACHMAAAGTQNCQHP